MAKQRVLIVCTGNSARSQMAEALLRHLAGDRFAVFSAGTRPAGVNPHAVRVMAELGIDISVQRSKSVDEFAGQNFDCVITVCDHAREVCPVFPGSGRRLHHSFQDPAAAPPAQQLDVTRRVRDAIRDWLEMFVAGTGGVSMGSSNMACAGAAATDEGVPMETGEAQVKPVLLSAGVRLPRSTPRNRRMWIAGIGGVLLLAVVVLALLPARVPVTQLATATIRDEAAGTGFVRAKVTIGVGAKINGIVLKMYVDQGDPVKKGQVMAELQNEDVHSQVGQAVNVAQAQQADLSVARANLAASRARFEASRTAVGRAEAGSRLAAINFQRARSLYQSGVWSKEAFDSAETANLQAQADVRNSQALQISAGEDVRAAEAAVAAAEKNAASSEAGVRLQRANLRYTIVTSPVDGYVVTRGLEEGATVVPGLSIFTIAAQSSPIWVSANIDERELEGLQVGQPATITLRSAPHRKFAGAVARVGQEADPVTEEVVVDVAFVQPPPGLKLNETAEVYILKAAKSGAKVLPRTAVVEGQQGPRVWLVTRGRLQSRAVSLGVRDKRGLIEVIDGLSDSDQLLVQPAAVGILLTPGKRVRTSAVPTAIGE